METQAAKAVRTKEEFERIRKKLEAEIEDGRSAERLSVNPDWLKIKGDAQRTVGEMEDQKYSSYDSLVSQDLDPLQKLIVVDRIKLYNQTISDGKFLIGLVDLRIKKGQEAMKELEQVRKEEEEFNADRG